MAYGLKYICEFTGGPNGLQPYTVELWFKDWSGTFYNIVGGSSPVTHGWDKDEPKPGIKGSSIDMQFRNPGNLPLSAFYSTDDDNCLVIYKWGSQVLFTGYLVQDDCNEIMVDFNHYINLTATDNLGLLKGISLLDAARLWGEKTTYTTYINRDSNYVFSVTEGPGTFPVQPGDPIEIIITDPDGVPYNGVYLVQQVAIVGGVVTQMQVATFISLPLSFGLGFTGTVVLTRPVDLSGRVSLAAIIRMCLLSTNLNLNCDVYANIIETVTTTPRFLEETFEGGNDYTTGNNEWKKCYDVLNIILERFNATLFQAEGVWNIVRWDELRYYNNEVTGFRYNSEMEYTGTIIQQDIFTTGFEQVTYPVTGITKSILGAFKYDKETFNYKQPANLLRNKDWQTLGDKLSETTVGSEIWTEYTMAEWFNYDAGSPYPERIIRVVTDVTTGLEVTRYGLVRGATFSDRNSAQSYNIEISEGDIVKLGFSYRTNVSQPGNVNNVFSLRLKDGTTTNYVQDDLSWGRPNGYTYNVHSGDNTNNWHSVQIDAAPAPFSGILNVYLAECTASSADETWYKNFSFEIIFGINESTNIIGQTHQNTQNQNPKANEDVEIFIDDSPRNSIQGTLFLPTFTGLLQDRTSTWMRPTYTESLRLGNITTFEQLYWRRTARTKLEGQMYGLVQNLNRTLRYTLTGSVGEVDIDTGLYKVISSALPTGVFLPGVTFELSGTGTNDGTYTVDSVIDATTFLVVEVMPGGLYVGEYVLTLDAILPRHISMLTIINYVGLSGLNFIFGRLTIDYARNNFNGTFWEQWRTGEVDSDIRNYYEFKYLYETK